MLLLIPMVFLLLLFSIHVFFVPNNDRAEWNTGKWCWHGLYDDREGGYCLLLDLVSPLRLGVLSSCFAYWHFAGVFTDTHWVGKDGIFSPPLEWGEWYVWALEGTVISVLDSSFSLRKYSHQWYRSFWGYTSVFRDIAIWINSWYL